MVAAQVEGRVGGGPLKFGGGVLLNCIPLYPACILMYPNVSFETYSVRHKISSGIHRDTSGTRDTSGYNRSEMYPIEIHQEFRIHFLHMYPYDIDRIHTMV